MATAQVSSNSSSDSCSPKCKEELDAARKRAKSAIQCVKSIDEEKSMAEAKYKKEIEDLKAENRQHKNKITNHLAEISLLVKNLKAVRAELADSKASVEKGTKEDQVSSNPSPTSCSPQCKENLADARRKATSATLCLQSLNEEISMIKSKHKKEVEGLQTEIRQHKHKITDHLAEINLLLKNLKAVRAELAESKTIIETWTNSAKETQKLLNCQVANAQKYGLGYNLTPPPPYYEIKNVGTTDDPVLMETVSEEVIVEKPKSSEKNQTSVVPIKFIQLRKGTTEHGSSSKDDEKVVKQKQKPVKQPQAQRVPVKRNGQKHKLMPKVSQQKAAAVKPKQKNHGVRNAFAPSKPFLSNNFVGCIPHHQCSCQHSMYQNFHHAKPFVQRVQQCFICGSHEHLAFACYYNQHNYFDNGFYPKKNFKKPWLKSSKKKTKAKQSGKVSQKTTQAKKTIWVEKGKEVKAERPKPKMVWVPKSN